MKIRTQAKFPAVLHIDGEQIDVRVKRMTNAEYTVFASAFARFGDDAVGPVDESAEVRDARNVAAADWARDVLNAHLEILAGQVEHEGREITQGGELVEIFGGRDDVIPQALLIVAAENRLSETQKKTYRSQLASRIGLLSGPPPGAPGSEPALAAAPVAPPASVANVDATGLDSGASSGTTAP